MRWACKRSYADANPLDEYDVPKPWRDEVKDGDRKGKAITFDQCVALLRACGAPYVRTIKREGFRDATWEQSLRPPAHLRSIVLIALRSGMRFSNIVNLRWEQVDLGAGTIAIDKGEMKGKRKWEAPLHSEVLAHLRGMLRARTDELGHAPAPADFVFDIGGDRRASIKNSFRKAVARAGLGGEGLRFHDLRHVFASHLADIAPEAAVACLLAHAATNVTRRYSSHQEIEALRAHLDRLRWLEPRDAAGATKTASANS